MEHEAQVQETIGLAEVARRSPQPAAATFLDEMGLTVQ